MKRTGLTKSMRAFYLVVVAVLLCACNGKQDENPVGGILDEKNIPAAEKLIIKYLDLYDTDRIFALADSLEKTGDISAMTANYYRAGAAIYLDNLKEAEAYLKKNIANGMPQNADLRPYLKSKTLLARLLSGGGKHGEALAEALPVLAVLDSLGATQNWAEMTLLTITIGVSQQNLHQPKEAAATFEKTHQMLRQWMDADSTGREYPRIITRYDNIATSYFNTSQYAEARKWLEREDSALTIYFFKPAANAQQVDMFKGSVALDQAQISQELGMDKQAFGYYNAFLQTNFSKTPLASINAVDYLNLAKRYDEAADNYAKLDEVMNEMEFGITLDNIGLYLLPKMRTNILAGRKDSALAVGMKIIECYDSVLAHHKQDAAAELATIYDTQGKERQIAQQQARLSRVRVIALIVSMIALLVFFIIYTIVRQRAAKRLAEVRAAKERIESELSIARNIQMSMVPSVFPDIEGLDMYAQMTPAKEVGGDLYGYQLEDNKLYFTVGDVSGKGVPASLFMAQATRLFLTLAKQRMMPADICTKMNDALSGNDNENGMFVTMFIGLLDLQTGHLDFCNAGHNPPVIGGGDHGGDFMEMAPNAPIGLFPGLEYEGEEIESVKGRAMVIYTDGLNEAENLQQEQLGEERVLELIRATHYESARQVVTTLARSVEQHRDGAEPNDDLTIMCLKI